MPSKSLQVQPKPKPQNTKSTMPSTTKMAKPRSQSKPISAKHKPRDDTKKTDQNQSQNQSQSQKQPHSWATVRGILTCKHQQQQQITEKKKQKQERISAANKKSKKMRCSGSLCSNTKVMHRPEHALAVAESSSSSSSNRVVSTSSSSLSAASSSSVSAGSSFRGMPFRRFSGCYECRMVIDPVLGFARDPSLRGTICSCPDCGEIFMKPENLELHQAVRHAVSELGSEDTSKNIVEIIFQSSWLKKQSPPICPKIDRILKVHNTQTTIANFEAHRHAVKSRAAARLPGAPPPRCVADGNELLRFRAATFNCSLGLRGSSNLCNSVPTCHVCSLIRHGFRLAAVSGDGDGILTTATSGRAHDGVAGSGEKRAMLVCRVIAGRVRRSSESGGDSEDYDSVAGSAGVYSNLDELYVFNPRAILPCFVVVYSGV